MIQYLIEVSIAWLVFYTIYIIFFKRETFFTVNRWYLVHSLIIGLLLPFVKNLPSALTSEIPTFYAINFMDSEMNIMPGIESNEALISSFSINSILTCIYLAGVAVGIARLIYGLYRIHLIWRSSEKKRMGSYTLVISDKVVLPFSFLNKVFVSRAFLELKQFKEIMQHELTHVKGRHTYDVLFMQALCILFWWNPLIYLYKRELKETHEYMADAKATSQSNRKNYSQFLLEHNTSRIELALTHQFFNSHLKNRLSMLYKKESAWKNLLRYTLVIPCFIGLLILFSSQTIISENNEEVQDSSNDILEMINNFVGKQSLDSDSIPEKKSEVFQEVDVMPVFPDCNKSYFTDKESEFCSRKKLMTYVFSNIKYPKAAKDKNLEGTVMVTFVVTTEGKIADTKIIKDIGNSFGEEAARVINSMNENLGRWKPGIKDGKEVSVLYTLPIRFNLDAAEEKIEAETTKKKKVEFMQGKKSSSDNMSQKPPKEKEIFKVVEQMPRFPGCEDMIDANDREKEDCAKGKMLPFIYNNLEYPQAAKDEGIEGMTVVQFIVAEDGSIRDVNVVRDIGGGCGDEAKRIVESMNDMEEKWTPAKQRGKPVKVLYTLPVKFKLE